MWKFIKSATNWENWLTSNHREVCFIGRSNVGKSSLINAITNNKNLAKTSNTPGRTQLINFFQEENKTIVDLPGYGFAKMPLKIKEKMLSMIEYYFKHRKQLVLTFLLLDSKIGPTNDDLQMIEFLKSLDCKFLIILTKLDKTNQSQKYFATKKIKELNLNFLETSSKKGTNIKKIKEIINDCF